MYVLSNRGSAWGVIHAQGTLDWYGRQLLRRSVLINRPVQSNTTYTVISAAAKLIAMTSTYPLQVVRSRMQVSDISETRGFGLNIHNGASLV